VLLPPLLLPPLLLALLPPSDALRLRLGRRTLLHSTAVAAAGAVAQVATAAPLSAFEKLKLDQALAELGEPTKTADPAIKSSLEAYSRAIGFVAEDRLADLDPAVLDTAGRDLGQATLGKAPFDSQVDSIRKRGDAVAAARKKKDASAGAKAAIALGDELTDLAYAWAAADRPAVPKSAIGAPATRPEAGTAFVEKVGGRSV